MNWSPLNVRIHSRTPRIRTLLPADAGGSFVNGLKKTNVCFAAACFSLCSLHYSIKGDVGTGGMAAKLAAARIATDSGSDMIIANADDVNVIHDLVNG